jgi:nucleoid-associated protein YgaU
MGLFSFSKGSGTKTLKKEEEAKAAAISQEEVNRLKINKMMADVNELNLPVMDVSLLINGEVVTVYGQAETQVAKELVVLTVGNNMGISSVDDRMSVVEPEPVEATFYEVKSGDSLSKIAKAHYGDANKYNAIFEANKPMLKDPNLIYPGQMLRIPQL